MPRSRRRNTPTGKWRRFFQAVLTSAAVSFSIASCTLNPQLREQATLESFGPLLEQLGVGLADAPASPGKTHSLVQTSFSACPQFFPSGVAPAVPAGVALRELCYDAFAVLHSGNTKTPVFVAQRLNKVRLLQARGVVRKDRFFADARLPRRERAELDDYRRSGLSRGHMAPAADMHSETAMAQSFSLANMVPQDQRHNGGAWAKIEEDTRKYVLRSAGDVYVFTGPVYGERPAKIGKGGVAVPSFLYKLVYDAETGKSWVHWQAHSAHTRPGRPIDYDDFVRRTGLHLLPSG